MKKYILFSSTLIFSSILQTKTFHVFEQKAIENEKNDNQPQANLRHKKQEQNFLQTSNKNEQYFDPELNQFDDKSYDKKDFYFWEEGVTNLAYDDFLETQFITNIEYLGIGYNLAYGNPTPSKGVDPGYTPYSAFEFVYQQNKLKALTADASYFVPDGVNHRTKTACQVSFESKDISSMEDYTQSLEAGISIEGQVFAFSFSASVDYKQTESGMQKSDTSYISTSAECMVHNLEIDRFLQPKWSQQLNNAFQHLIQNQNEDEAWEFFESFGTHVTIGVELGAKFGYYFEMKASEVEKIKQMGLSVEVGASGYGQSVSGYTNFQRDSKQAFQNALTSWKQVSIGALPDEENDALKWAQKVRDSPMPIRGKFIAWDHFIRKFSDGNTEFSQQQLDQLITLFQSALESYCSGYLKPNAKVNSCGSSANNLFQGLYGGYNVPGGVLEPGVDYTKIGGADGYKWELLTTGCRDVAVDSTGYIFCLKTNHSIKYLKPGDTNWSSLAGMGKKIASEKGKMVFINMQGAIRYWNIHFDSHWSTFNNQSFTDTCIDEEGHIWAINSNTMCYFRDPSHLVRCFTNYKRFVTCANGVLYTTHQGSGEHIFTYNHSTAVIQDIATQYHSQPLDGCITEAGWGWKAQSDQRLWYMENIKEWNEYGNTDVDGSAVKIDCASTETGPIVVMAQQNGEVYIRVVDLGTG